MFFETSYFYSSISLDYKQLLNEVFVISRIIEVEVVVISLSLRFG